MKKIYWSLFVFLFAVVAWQMALSPKTEGAWRSENKNLPEMRQENNTLVVQNFRDFFVDESGKKQENWTTETFDLNKVEGMDFIISHFAEYHGIAHSFITFRFADGKNLAISMEARMEEGEEYSPFWGLLNQFPMIYLIGSERDFIGSRIGYRHEEVYLYETMADREMTKKILLSFVQSVNDLKKNPKFYNTLWRNCTTSIVQQLETVMDKNIWWSWEHLFPGYADEKALKIGFLKNEKNLSFPELEQSSKISGKGILQTDENFEKAIRKK